MIAVISDIHGNVWALEAVLKDAKRRGVTRFINLGDLLYGPLKPRETFELLHTIEAVIIQGNEDRRIYETADEQDKKNRTLEYVKSELGEKPLMWMNSLPRTALISGNIFACHGSPSDDKTYLLENVQKGFPVIKSETEIAAELKGIESLVVLCGHTHLPRVVQLSSGQIIINPGSVGLPAYDDDLPVYHTMETYSPFASYAIIEQQEKIWNIELLKVSYNYMRAAEQARKLKRTDWADWLISGKVSKDPSF